DIGSDSNANGFTSDEKMDGVAPKGKGLDRGKAEDRGAFLSRRGIECGDSIPPQAGGRSGKVDLKSSGGKDQSPGNEPVKKSLEEYRSDQGTAENTKERLAEKTGRPDQPL